MWALRPGAAGCRDRRPGRASLASGHKRARSGPASTVAAGTSRPARCRTASASNPTSTSSMPGAAPVAAARARHDRALEPEARRLAQPLLQPPTARISPASPTSPNTTVPRRPAAARRRRDRARDARSIAGSASRSAAGDVDEHVAIEVAARALGEHREQQRDAVAVDAGRGAPADRRARRRDQRLDLDEQRPRAVRRRDHDRARRADRPLGEQGRRVRRPRPARRRASRTRRSPASSRSGSCARAGSGRPALALELEHDVDQVLERLGPGEPAVLGDVTDEDVRDRRSSSRTA